MMTIVTNQDLWERYVQTRDPALREELILRYAPLVRYVIGRLAIVRPALLDADDLLSEGSIGLIEALDRYDPTIGVKFETYAIPRIRGSITDSLRRADFLSRGALRRVRSVQQAIGRLHQELQRQPTDQEVIQHLGIAADDYYAALIDANVLVLPLDAPTGSGPDGESVQLADLLPDTRFPAPDDAVARADLVNSLSEAIQQLPERDRLILGLYYQEELTLREIGQVLDVSESRVCQIHGRLVLRLRALLGGETAPSTGFRGRASLTEQGVR